MLIEAARRAAAAVKEMLAIANSGAATTEELVGSLGISKAIAAINCAFQTSAAASVAGRERHGDGGAEALADTAGLSRRDAHSHIRTAEALRGVPAACDALEQGRVSMANAKQLAQASEKTSSDAVECDGDLLAKAESMRPAQFAREARRWAVELIAELPGGDRLPRAVLNELACHAAITGMVYDTKGALLWQGNANRTATVSHHAPHRAADPPDHTSPVVRPGPATARAALKDARATRAGPPDRTRI